MKTPRWSFLVVALLLGLVTGDFFVHHNEGKQSEVSIQAPLQAEAEFKPDSFFSSEN